MFAFRGERWQLTRLIKGEPDRSYADSSSRLKGFSAPKVARTSQYLFKSVFHHHSTFFSHCTSVFLTMSGDKKSNVTFTKCPIDATKIQGAIHKWQLEDGQIIDPANVVTDKQSLTTNKLYTWANNEAKKEWEFQGKADLSFDNGETVIWTGLCRCLARDSQC